MWSNSRPLMEHYYSITVPLGRNENCTTFLWLCLCVYYNFWVYPASKQCELIYSIGHCTLSPKYSCAFFHIPFLSKIMQRMPKRRKSNLTCIFFFMTGKSFEDVNVIDTTWSRIHFFNVWICVQWRNSYFLFLTFFKSFFVYHSPTFIPGLK